MFRKVFNSKSGNGERVVDLSTFYIVEVFNFHSVTVFNYCIQVISYVKGIMRHNHSRHKCDF